MKKNILIINSRFEKNPFLIDSIKELEKKDYVFKLLSSESDFLRDFEQNKKPWRKIYLGPLIEGRFGLFKFFLAYPLLLFYHFCLIIIEKRGRKIQSVICLDWNEKFIYTPLAKIFRMNILWFERTEINYRKVPRCLLGLYKRFYQKVKLVVFTNKAKIKLESLGFDKENIHLIYPGIRLKKEVVRQDSIFSELSKKERANFNRKYFTLGAVTDYFSPNQIENLFQAIKICQTVIPNIQLILVGDGPNKKQAAWTAGKMDMENITWFVGRQTILEKWLGNFDIYITVAEIVKLSDIKLLLKAVNNGLPILSFRGVGYGDFVYENETGFLSELGDNESLAQNILKLRNNKLLAKKLGKQGRSLVEEKFNIKYQSEKFEKIL